MKSSNRRRLPSLPKAEEMKEAKGKGKGDGRQGRNREPSASRTSRGKMLSGIEWFQNRKGKFEPLCCFEFLNTGGCNNEAERGKPGRSHHYHRRVPDCVLLRPQPPSPPPCARLCVLPRPQPPLPPLCARLCVFLGPQPALPPPQIVCHTEAAATVTTAVCQIVCFTKAAVAITTAVCQILCFTEAAATVTTAVCQIVCVH